MIINTDTLSWPTYRELEIGVFSPKCSMPTIPFPQMLRDPHGRGGWNTVRARGGKNLQTQNQYFPDTTGQLCIGMHRDCDITLQSPYKLKPDKILAWKGSWEVPGKLLPPVAVRLALHRSWEGRAKAFFNGGSPDGKPCTRASPSQE